MRSGMEKGWQHMEKHGARSAMGIDGLE